MGLGKAGEVINAISKATDQAKKNLIRVSLLEGTIPYPVNAKFGAAKVMLKPASAGTGVIAGGPVRAICEMAGVHNILTKSNGSSNPHNLSKATFFALKNMGWNDQIQVEEKMSEEDIEEVKRECVELMKKNGF